MRAGKALLLSMLMACLGGGALIGLDRIGDGRAYEAAERHLLQSEIVRLTFGEEAVVERTGGSVMADKVLNWNGHIRGAGYVAEARVGMARQSTDDPWEAVRATFQLPGKGWLDAYPSTDLPEPEPEPQSSQLSVAEKRAWDFVSTAVAPPPPGPGDPVPVLHHGLTMHVRSLARRVGAEAALTFADSAGRIIGDDLLRTYATAVALEETDQPLIGAAVMRDWIDENPPNSQAWTGLARLYHKATRFPQALEATSRALDTDPDNGEALRFQGLAYFGLGDREAALRSYAEACRRQDVLGCELERSLAASR